MKLRTGFVTNSSSSSFTIAKSNLTADQIDKIKNHIEAAKELAKKLEDLKVEVKIKTGEGGKTFGSVSTKEISAAAKAQLGLDLDKKKMQLEESIKTLGTHEVPIRLHAKVTGILRVHVSGE